ncbi:MAG: response regulator [Candidatus Methylomirabilis oxygeniifera]|uniref:histidine kinase n=1 Tax=Methylomirabilis oxygeniifera TaxID=671143 RepID=D5MG95_METO1|nr:MAG: response regulator [Candidatus Methylomirabilis oxyfera]CBE68776.1 putative Histidine kinase [Candidatus Methylomirabilis oxyfera]
MEGSIFRRFTFLSVLIAFVVLIPLVIFGFSAIQVASDQLLQHELDESKQEVLTNADQLKRVFDMAQADLTMLRELTIRKLRRVRAAGNEAEMARWYDAIGQAFLTVADSRRIYNQIRYLNEYGREVIRVDYDGIHPPQLIPPARLQDKRQRDYFSETMKLAPGQVYVSRLDLNQEHGQIEVPYRPVIRYAMPLFDDAGHRSGIVIVNLQMEPLLDTLYQKGKAAQREVRVVDQEGFYLLHSNPNKQWGGPHELNTGERIQRDLPDLAGRLLSQQAVARVMAEQVVAAQPLLLSTNNAGPFIVVVELMPTHVALAPITDLHLYLLILLVGTSILAIGCAALLGDKLTRPIVALQQAAHQIRHGNLNTAVETRGPREIAALSEAFNAMAGGLAQAQVRIDRHLARLHAINQIWTAAGNPLSLHEVIDHALDATLLCLGVEAAEIFLLNEERTEVVLVGHRGAAQEAFRETTHFKLQEGFPGLATFSAEVVLTTDLPNDPRFLRKQVIEAGFKTFAAIPLKVTGQVIGAMNVATRTSCTIIKDDLPILTAIGSTIGMVVANARLFEAQRDGAQQLAEKVEELDGKIDELERMQARLIEAERLRAMGQMAAGVAHDFNNALMAVLGQAQLIRLFLERGHIAAVMQNVAEYVEVLERLAWQEQAILDAANIVRKIREATRSHGEEPFALVSLNEIVEQVLETTRPRWKDQAEAKGLSVTIALQLGDVPPVLGNAAELREALINVLFNALDAMPHGGTITIATRRAPRTETGETLSTTHTPRSLFQEPPAGRTWVVLSVTDTGIGMSQDVKARLFEPFFTTKGSHGTGLGLNMVQGIVHRHEGEIHITSAEGWGTSISIHLPAAQEDRPEPSTPAPPPPLPGRLRLLVIDDEPLLGETLVDLLGLLGHEAVAVTSGEAGIARLQAERFDLVMTDIGMAGMSGWDVARAVKADWSQLPVILVSGWAGMMERDQIEGAGIDAVLAKPYTITQLEHALSRVVASTRRDAGSDPLGTA